MIEIWDRERETPGKAFAGIPSGDVAAKIIGTRKAEKVGFVRLEQDDRRERIGMGISG